MLSHCSGFIKAQDFSGRGSSGERWIFRNTVFSCCGCCYHCVTAMHRGRIEAGFSRWSRFREEHPSVWAELSVSRHAEKLTLTLLVSPTKPLGAAPRGGFNVDVSRLCFLRCLFCFLSCLRYSMKCHFCSLLSSPSIGLCPLAMESKWNVCESGGGRNEIPGLERSEDEPSTQVH